MLWNVWAKMTSKSYGVSRAFLVYVCALKLTLVRHCMFLHSLLHRFYKMESALIYKGLIVVFLSRFTCVAARRI